MLKDYSNSSKLLPLRKFSIPEVYSVFYLSQLVQRKKLKAKKIGRNYYTCENWFNEYLEKHAQDKKIIKYEKYLENKKLKDSISQLDSRPDSQPFTHQKNNFFVIIKNILNLRKIAIITAIFILFLIINLFYLSKISDNGQVAGEYEENISNFNISTSSINK